jgi:para-aminobenzoate synthetase component I
MSQADASGFALFRDDWAGRELRFAEPGRVVAPEGADDFSAALDALEAARTAGKWLAGYFSYEAGFLLEPKLRPLLPEKRRVPLFCMGVFDGPDEGFAAPASPLTIRPPTNGPIFEARAAWSPADYARRFRRLHRHLAEGDCYQANLTFPVHAEWSGSPRAAFDALTARQPVRYGALVALGGPVVLSRSPELFFGIDRLGTIEARPMKGTIPRGTTPDEDAANREFLRADPKSQAENRMIVDLLRNDISLIGETGSVHVPELFAVETYPTLHTMVSRVRAKTLPGLSIRDVFAALFPCGSVTGAPKIRAMEILRELEETPRGVYCGAIGWIAPDGTMRFSVAIRTLTLFSGGEALFNVGGGVVFDSTTEGEYAEALLKARFATGAEPAVPDRCPA